jgi:nitric oxide reductase subunit C
MHIGARKLLMALLVSAYVVQTGIVYLDDTADKRDALSPLALEGRRIWHSHNCQACHQFYGFGGFLGPDLTNASHRLTRSRLDQILTKGALPMPSFWLSRQEIDAIESYLAEMDKTGIGVARHEVQLDRDRIWSLLDSKSASMSEEARRGLQLFRKQCNVCHLPFESTSLGLNTAPDLSSVQDRLSAEDIDLTMKDGRPAKGMPPTGLDADQRKQVRNFFGWMRREREGLLHEIHGPLEKRGLPWWDYR